MKQIIVMIASVILGLAIVSIIAGPDDSVYSTLKKTWEKESEIRVLTDEPAR